MIILVAVVILISIGVFFSRYRSKKRKFEIAEQQRVTRVEEIRQAAIKRQEQIERDKQVDLKRQKDEQEKLAKQKQKEEQERLSLENDPERQRLLSLQQSVVDGARPVGCKVELENGNLFNFILTGKTTSITFKNLKGKNITYTYAYSADGFRIMVPTAYTHRDIVYFAQSSTKIKCVIISTSIGGRTVRYVAPANEEELERQKLIDQKIKLEKDRQESLRREKEQAELKRRQAEGERLKKQKELDEQRRQEEEKQKMAKVLSESGKYVGEYKNGKIHGKGELIYMDGKRYEGEFVDGKIEGYGILSFVSGEQYEGNFKAGKYHGRGRLITENGDVIEGNFEDGSFVSDKVGEEVITYLSSHEDGKPYYLFIDTETTGLLEDSELAEYYYDRDYLDETTKLSNLLNSPRLVRLSYIIHDKYGNELASNDFIIKPTGFTIPPSVAKIHGITTVKAEKEGWPLKSILNHFRILCRYVSVIIGHKIYFDKHVISTEFLRYGVKDTFWERHQLIDTMFSSLEFCWIKGKHDYNKYPKLSELHYKLFKTNFDGAHDSSVDVAITAKCFWELKRLKII